MNQERIVQAAYFLLRVVAGLMFYQAGAMKLFGWFGGMPGGGVAVFPSQIWIGGVLEVVGGVLIMLGLFVRPVAFILSGEMAVAYFQFHQPGGFWPVQNQGVPAVLYCFIYLYMAARGGGDWSLDGFIKRKRGAAPSAA
ncbi:MAG TPA: DoxX family protein [Verrucomicrobiae bacterium]|nr:DoxX family protein [Verrucomicrobiae bacterium]